MPSTKPDKHQITENHPRNQFQFKRNQTGTVVNAIYRQKKKILDAFPWFLLHVSQLVMLDNQFELYTGSLSFLCSSFKTRANEA